LKHSNSANPVLQVVDETAVIDHLAQVIVFAANFTLQHVFASLGNTPTLMLDPSLKVSVPIEPLSLTRGHGRCEEH
jgi:hypothetical protein